MLRRSKDVEPLASTNAFAPWSESSDLTVSRSKPRFSRCYKVNPTPGHRLGIIPPQGRAPSNVVWIQPRANPKLNRFTGDSMQEITLWMAFGEHCLECLRNNVDIIFNTRERFRNPSEICSGNNRATTLTIRDWRQLRHRCYNMCSPDRHGESPTTTSR